MDEYQAYIEAERMAWGRLRVAPLPDYHPIKLEESMELRKKIRAQERKRLEQERLDHQGD
jgi:hypothetical protein